MNNEPEATDGKAPALAYFVPEFPTQTHAFFWRELRALEELGARIRVFSSSRPPEAACPHDFAEAARNRTTYLFPPRWAKAVSFLVRHPIRTARAVSYILALSETPLARRLGLLGLVPCAADLCCHLQRSGIRHIHIHSVATSLHLGALARILAGVSYSGTVHGNLPVYGTDHGAKFRNASLITAVTGPLIEEVEHAAPGTPSALIWMGVDIDRFTPKAQTAMEPHPCRFLTVARLNQTKGHAYFLEALARLQQAHVDFAYELVGDGPFRDRIEADIARLGLAERVFLSGSLSEGGVLARLRDADCLVLPSYGHGEAAPVSVMEAMACGLPVISSVIGGTPDMIETGRDGLLVAQKDVDGLEAAALQIAKDPELRQRLGQAARRTAVAKFDYRQQARKLLDALRPILESR